MANWKTVRVFISSTFRDMHAERDHLVKVVFPALRERLEKHRIYLIDIDLRWGVTREQAENDKVLDLCLQQIDECRPFFIGILGQRYGWVPTSFPADSVTRFGWIQQQTGKSVTELEIHHGVLHDSKMRGRAFFYFRNSASIQAVPEDIRRAVYAETDRGQIEKLEELKKKIRYSGFPVMENYPARWDSEAYDRPSRSKGRLVDLDEFGMRVHDQLWHAIEAEFQLPEKPPAATQPDLLAEELDYHERFMESRLRVFVGREQINNELLAFADANDSIPCLVTGPSGSGKSAALARFVRDYQHKQPQTLVIPHFVGASPPSTNLRDMLRRFCLVFKARFGFAEDVPEEVAKLSVTFREYVGKVPADTRVLLAIDALNQLDEADRAQELYWLPTELPPQVKVIVSCITDSGKTEPVLEAFNRRKHCPVPLAVLSAAEQREIIRQVPSLSAKTLDDDQVRLLLSNPATANPLFLLVALEELRGFASYERLNERIAAFPREGDTVTAIFIQVIERLSEEFNQKLVETVLTLLASARRGLSERELQELVAGLDGADELFPVLRQLRPYLLSRAGLVDFYHRNLFKAVRERYLDTPEREAQSHKRLAQYFQGFLQAACTVEARDEQYIKAGSWESYFARQGFTIRVIEELPWQLARAESWQQLHDLLSSPAFLNAAWSVNEFDVKAYWSDIENRTSLRLVETYRPVYENPAAHSVDAWYVSTLLMETGYHEEGKRLLEFFAEQFDRTDDPAARLHALGNLGLIHFDHGEIDQAIALFLEQERLARLVDHSEGLAAALGNRANALAVRGDLHSALALYEQQEQVCVAADNQAGLAHSLANRAMLYRRRGDHKQSILLEKRAEQIYRERGAQLDLAICINNQGFALFEQGRHDEAMALYQDAERMYRDLGAQQSLARCLANQALILETRGDLAGLVALYEEQIALCRSLKQREWLAGCLAQLAMVVQAQGDHPRGLQLLEEEEQLWRECGDMIRARASQANQARLRGQPAPPAPGSRSGLEAAAKLHLQAKTLFDRQQYVEALALYQQEEALLGAAEHQKVLGQCLINQSWTAFRLRQHEDGIAFAERAEVLLDEVADLKGAAHAAYLQGEIYKEQTDFENALQAYTRSEQCWRHLGDSRGLVEILNGKAQVLFRCNNPEGALALEKEQEQLWRTLNQPQGIAQCLTRQATILAGPLRRPREALPLALQAQELASAQGITALVQHLVGLLRKLQADLAGSAATPNQPE